MSSEQPPMDIQFIRSYPMTARLPRKVWPTVAGPLRFIAGTSLLDDDYVVSYFEEKPMSATYSITYRPLSMSASSEASPAPTPSPTSHITDELRRLHKQGHDISAVKAEIDKLDTAKKARIVAGLRGVADLALLQKAEARRFVLAYWENNEACYVDGVEFGDTSTIKDEVKYDEYRVFLEDTECLDQQHYTMSDLRKGLDELNTPYVLLYRD